jgi:hypothetical protein
LSLSCPSLLARILGSSLALITILSSLAHADARFELRMGVLPLALTPSADTPMVGGYVDDAVTAYNAAARAHNAAHDYAPGSTMATAPIDRGALAMRTTMVTFAPGVEAGGDHLYARLEGVIGIGDHLRALGFGVYPLNLAAPVRGGTIVPYLAVGGTIAWLDRTNDDGQVGGLCTVRIAVGVRFARRATVELGYGAYAFGGVLDRARLDTMSGYDPRGAAPPPAPSAAVAGGEQRGFVDVSLGVGL